MLSVPQNRYGIIHRIPLGTAVALFLLATCTVRAQVYSIVEISSPDAAYVDPVRMSSNGAVVGEADDDDLNSIAFIWRDGAYISLMPPSEWSISSATDVTDDDRVVGALFKERYARSAAFLYAGGVFKELPALQLKGMCEATAINAAGMIVGSAEQDNQIVAVSWTGAGVTRLPGVDRFLYSTAADVSANGIICGSGMRAVTFLFHGWVIEDDVLTELPLLGGLSNAQALSINEFGSAAGFAYNVGGESAAVLWTDGRVTDLGNLGRRASCAQGMNNLGQVVGYSTTSAGQMHACLWSGGNVIDLNTRIAPYSGWLLGEATDVDDGGNIIGSGIHNGDYVGFMLVPAGFGSDADSDFDGVPDSVDNCPTTFNPQQSDSDGDGVGDACESDSGGGSSSDDDDDDDDGVPNVRDQCSGGNDAIDTDGDGVPDCADGCPYDANRTQAGPCGCRDTYKDTDHDGIPDCSDNCPLVWNEDQHDTDHDGIGDRCDNCPEAPNHAQSDIDGDGRGDSCDGCPADPNKTSPGLAGCGRDDDDFSGNGGGNGGPPTDLCPDDPDKTTPGACGCGTPDYDTDGDGVADCNDNCPHVANLDQLDADGDGVGDACSESGANQGTPGSGTGGSSGGNSGSNSETGSGGRAPLCGGGALGMAPIMVIGLWRLKRRRSE